MPRASICTLGGGGNLSRSDDFGEVLVLERGNEGFAVAFDTDDVAVEVGILLDPNPDEDGGGPMTVDVIVLLDTAAALVGVKDSDNDDGERCIGVVGIC